jgi:hypothetical protein
MLTGVTLRDRIKSEDLRDRWRVYEMVQEVQNCQFKWMQHVLRFAANCLHRDPLKYKLHGRRGLGDHIAAGQISSCSRITGKLTQTANGKKKNLL